MRSISVLKHLHHQLPSSTSSNGCVCVDSVHGWTFVLSYDDTKDACNIFLSQNDGKFELLTTVLPEAETTMQQGGRPIAMQSLPESSSVCVALASGDIYVLSLSQTASVDELDCVGTIDGGIRAMRWSPDRELVVFVTGIDTILEMTKEFDALAESPLHSDSVGEEVMVNVGWGKKETQFHGSEGKMAAQKKQDTLEMSVDDDGQPRISWRGDGNFFVVSSLFHERRVLRVYDRDAILQSTSEPVNQLEHLLSWRPSGNLIASSQRLPHRHDVVFFERNGLRHGEFTIREPSSTKVVELAWNGDSTVLLVRLDRLGTSVLQLWSMSNYSYLLKQELRINDVVATCWDEKNPLKLHVSTQHDYHQFQLCWDTVRNEALSPENPATVAVVDGVVLGMTPFKFANTPPPMARFQVKLPTPARHVTFLPWKPHGDDFAVLLCDDSIAVFESHSTGRPVAAPSFVKQVASPGGYMLRQLTAWTEQKFLALNFDAQETLLVLDCTDEEWRVERTIPLPLSAIRIVPFWDSEPVAVVELEDGSLLTMAKDGLLEEGWQGCLALPNPATWLQLVPVNDEVKLLSLDDGNLRIDASLYATDVTSVFCHTDAMILSTSNHEVHLIPWPTSRSMPSIEFSNTIDGVRRIERGSRIVTAVQGEQSLVLQAPRGNLETVYPRLLVLSHVRHLLNQSIYKQALLLCRKHRIDLNILFDHNPGKFVEQVEDLIRQVDNVDHLNLFLSDLQNDIVQENKSIQSATKVNDVCQVVRSSLEKIDAERYTQSILTTFVKQQPPRLEEALERIKKIKETSPEAAEEALKYVIFLVDVDRLYNVALGMYDFGLVLMVAQHSHKDPREYLPFLTELQALSQPMQRYRIDDYLQRHAPALKHLATIPDGIQDVLRYSNKHKLWKDALETYKERSEYPLVLEAYAKYLEANNKWEEAGIAFSLCEKWESAKECFEKGLHWRDVMAMCDKMHVSETDRREVAKEMADELFEDRQYIEAGLLLRDHAKDLSASVNAFVRGADWQAALYTASGDDELVGTVKNGAEEAAVQMLGDLATLKETLDKRKSRLVIVREEKANRSDIGLPMDDSLDNIDVMSDTTSMKSRVSTVNSALSGASNRSSKSRRKHELKKLRGKEGSVYEEEYLVNSHTKAVEQAAGLQTAVGKLLQVLTRFGEFSVAHKLDETLSSYLQALCSSETMDLVYAVQPEYVVATLRVAANQPPVRPTLVTCDWRMNF